MEINNVMELLNEVYKGNFDKLPEKINVDDIYWGKYHDMYRTKMKNLRIELLHSEDANKYVTLLTYLEKNFHPEIWLKLPVKEIKQINNEESNEYLTEE